MQRYTYIQYMPEFTCSTNNPNPWSTTGPGLGSLYTNIRDSTHARTVIPTRPSMHARTGASRQRSRHALHHCLLAAESKIYTHKLRNITSPRRQVSTLPIHLSQRNHSALHSSTANMLFHTSPFIMFLSKAFPVASVFFCYFTRLFPNSSRFFLFFYPFSFPIAPVFRYFTRFLSQ